MFNKFIQLRSRGEKLKPTTSLETEDYSLLNILSDNSIDIQEVSQTPLYQYITSNLTEREQSIFTMKYIDGMKNKDIAAELDAKVSTTNVHVFRIKSKIQSLVSKVTLDERSGRVISKKVALATKLDKMAARKGLHIGAQPKYTSWSEKLDEIAKDKGIDTIISPYTRH